MRSELLYSLEGEYARRREQNAALTRRRQAEAAARVPRIGEILRAREALIRDGMRGILAHEARYEDLPARMEALNRELADTLVANGYPADYLEPVYTCPICQDTGYTGEPVREMCACLRQALSRRMAEEIGLETDGSQTFATWQEDIFPNDSPLPGMPCTQRQQMGLYREAVQTWAEKWPEGQPNTVLLTGKSGLGKTFMLRCMARVLLDRGLNVMLLSAYRLLEEARKAWFGQENAMESIGGADVLLVDDLGSEPLMQNVTIEQFYQVINTRQNQGRGLVISTNLSVEELKARYTERIASRLTDKRGAMVLRLQGEDVRRR